MTSVGRNAPVCCSPPSSSVPGGWYARVERVTLPLPHESWAQAPGYTPKSAQDGALRHDGQRDFLEFKDGHGEFYDQEEINGRVIFTRYAWSKINTSSPHFEQAYSDDGGKTWEVNWITEQTKVKP